jgi:hypothetical protein
MNIEEKKLYSEWKDLENKLRETTILYEDIVKANEIRLRVWDELKEKLPIGEKFELGSRLEKPIREIYAKYPPESWPLAKQWGTKAIHRASGGFHFLLRCLEEIHRGSTDPAYSRSAYILLSFNCELLFESYLLLLLKDEFSRKTEPELTDLLKGKNNHDLEELSEKIGDEDLKKLGVDNVRLTTKNDLKRYLITLIGGDDIIVEDSIHVRYDFKYDRKRDVDPDESERMKNEIGHLLKMTDKVMKLIPAK